MIQKQHGLKIFKVVGSEKKCKLKWMIYNYLASIIFVAADREKLANFFINFKPVSRYLVLRILNFVLQVKFH